MSVEKKEKLMSPFTPLSISILKNVFIFIFYFFVLFFFSQIEIKVQGLTRAYSGDG